MPVTINPIAAQHWLGLTFVGGVGLFRTPNSSFAINAFRVFSGTQPANPTITTGITACHASDVAMSNGNWLPPSNGVISLAAPLAFTSNGARVGSFVRFYGNNVSSQSTPVMDVPLGTSIGAGNALINSVDFANAVTYNISTLRIKLNTVGTLFLNNAVANCFLGLMIGMPPQSSEGGQYGLGAFSRWGFTSGSGTFTKALTVKAYDGTPPASALVSATGNLLWSKTLTADSLLAVSGLGMALTGDQSANATLSGTPSYIRIEKAAWTDAAAGISAPACLAQVPIGVACAFSPATVTAGADTALSNLTIVLTP